MQVHSRTILKYKKKSLLFTRHYFKTKFCVNFDLYLCKQLEECKVTKSLKINNEAIYYFYDDDFNGIAAVHIPEHIT